MSVFKSKQHYFGRFFCLIFLLLLSSVLFSQNLTTTLYNQSNGLTQRDITSIQRDSNGFFWLITEKGLVRFDGANFIEVNPNNKRNESLRISRIHIYDSLLYAINANNGCDIVNLNNFNFSKFSNKKIADLICLKDSIIFLLSVDGNLEKYINRKFVNRVKLYKANESHNDANLYYWRGHLMLNDRGYGLVELDQETGNLKHRLLNYKADITKVLLRSNNNYLIVVDRNQTFYFDQFLKLKKSKIVNNNIDFFLLNDYTEFDNSESFYISNGKNIFSVNKSNFSTNILLNKVENPELHCFYILDANNILVGTNQGLIKLSNKLINVTHFKESIENNFIKIRRKIVTCPDSSLILLGYPYLYYAHNGKQFNRIGDKTISAIDGCVIGNELYFTTEGAGLNKLNLVSKKIKKIIIEPDSPNNFLYGLYFNTIDSLLIVGGNDVLGSYNLKNGVFSKIKIPDNPSVKVITHDSKSGIYLLGTDRGFYVMDKYFNLKKYNLLNDTESSLNIRDILIEKETGLIWVAYTKGILVIDNKNFKVLVKIDDKIFNNPITVSLLEDNKKHIWAATYDGLYVFDNQFNQLMELNRRNGFFNTEFNYKSAGILHNGNLAFGGLNGYDIIGPEWFNYKISNKRGLITGYEIKSENNSTLHPFINGSKGPLNFNIENESLKIYLSVENDISAMNYTYLYSLDSVHWINTNRLPYLEIYKLDPAEYTLYIKCFDEYGKKIVFTPITIIAKQPFYKSSYFAILLMALLVFILLLLIYSLINNKKRENNIRENISMDLHDEIGSQLTSILYINKMKNSHRDDDEINSYLENILFNLRLYINTITLKLIPFGEFESEIRDMLYRTFSNIDYSLIIDRGISPDLKLNSGLIRDIKMCLYEITNNVIKHSKATYVSIEISLNKKQLFITVKDNGIFNDIIELNKNGNGIRNLKKRVLKNKGEIKFDLGESEHGLVLLISLPAF